MKNFTLKHLLIITIIIALLTVILIPIISDKLENKPQTITNPRSIYAEQIAKNNSLTDFYATAYPNISTNYNS